ncbi:protein LAZY 1 isoform X1 [Cucumis melo var. makuwa]|uniref:Protein LAZY 1 isoform X1 n=2 Tax=Cucumis melo TaxID=3656 RepID=A0A5A7TTM2_CUCMM|nr:protein LAZY 1 isoform X1 [Cucumis melo var. makuwa]
MKLLGWMHRKFRQNNGQVPLKEFVNGQQTSDEQQYFPRTSTNNPFKQAHRDLDIARTDEDYEDESLISISEIFPGFLAIGTFGSSEPATPKFSISIDHITESDQTEVTKNELKLINDELEKVLEVEAKDEGGSRQDSSHANKVESNYNNVESGDHDAVVCPLQEYLFGSAVEMSTTMAKKENRTSLGELFQRSKVVEEGGGGRCDQKDEQKKVEKEGDKYGMQLLKKKLKKKMFCAASKSTLSSNNASGEVLDVSTATKLHKILHLFNRKVYPAESIAMAKDQKGDHHKAQKNYDKKKKTTTSTDIGRSSVNKNNNEETTSTDEDIMIFPKQLILKQTLQSIQTRSGPPRFSDIIDDDVDFNYWNKEQWIKSDSDCK